MKLPFLLEEPTDADFPVPESLAKTFERLPTQEDRNLARASYIYEQKMQRALALGTSGVNIGRVLGMVFAAFLAAVLIGGPAFLQMIQNRLDGK